MSITFSKRDQAVLRHAINLIKEAGETQPAPAPVAPARPSNSNQNFNNIGEELQRIAALTGGAGTGQDEQRKNSWNMIHMHIVDAVKNGQQGVSDLYNELSPLNQSDANVQYCWQLLASYAPQYASDKPGTAKILTTAANYLQDNKTKQALQQAVNNLGGAATNTGAPGNVPAPNTAPATPHTIQKNEASMYEGDLLTEVNRWKHLAGLSTDESEQE